MNAAKHKQSGKVSELCLYPYFRKYRTKSKKIVNDPQRKNKRKNNK